MKSYNNLIVDMRFKKTTGTIQVYRSSNKTIYKSELNFKEMIIFFDETVLTVVCEKRSSREL